MNTCALKQRICAFLNLPNQATTTCHSCETVSVTIVHVLSKAIGNKL